MTSAITPRALRLTATLAASLALGALGGCARSAHVPATPEPGWHPSSLTLFVDTHSPPLCSANHLPRPRFYVRSAEMRPEDTLAVQQFGRCLASPSMQPLRVQLSGTPDRAGGADGRLPFQRAARVEQLLVANGVAPQRITITTVADRPDLDGRVAIDVLR